MHGKKKFCVILLSPKKKYIFVSGNSTTAWDTFYVSTTMMQGHFFLNKFFFLATVLLRIHPSDEHFRSKTFYLSYLRLPLSYYDYLCVTFDFLWIRARTQNYTKDLRKTWRQRPKSRPLRILMKIIPIRLR